MQIQQPTTTGDYPGETTEFEIPVQFVINGSEVLVHPPLNGWPQDSHFNFYFTGLSDLSNNHVMDNPNGYFDDPFGIYTSRHIIWDTSSPAIIASNAYPRLFEYANNDDLGWRYSQLYNPVWFHLNQGLTLERNLNAYVKIYKSDCSSEDDTSNLLYTFTADF